MPENELPPERKLQTAVRSGDLDEVSRLCELGIDEDKSHEWGPDFRSSLLYSAVLTYPDFSGGTPPKARATGHTEIVSYLLKRGANANYIEENDEPMENKTLLHWAAGYGYKDIAALLIQHRADVNAKWEATGQTPLATAVSSYNDDAWDASEEKDQRIFDTIRLLVDKGADVNTRNNTKEEPDDIGNTILHRIAGKGELVEYLVAKGADLNAKNQGGWTPLHTVAIYSKFSATTTTARALIAAGADLNARDNNGKIPLDYAQNDALKALLQSSQTLKSVSPSETPAKRSGCVGVLAVISCLIAGFVILLLVNKGTTAGRGNSVVPAKVNYSTAANANTASTPLKQIKSIRNAQDWQGEHFPQTRNAYLQAADIQGWSYSGVRYALNEMYARHGYIFKESPLRHQFQKFSWYHPALSQTSADIEAQFTPIERANQHLLSQQRTILVQEGQAIK